MMKKIILLSVVFVLLAGVSSVFAIPALQLYIEGSTYDTVTETWLTNSSSFTLWVMGNVSGKGEILDVRLAVAYDSSESGSVDFTVADPSTPSPSAPALFSDSSTIGYYPITGVKEDKDGNKYNEYLQSHGIYGPGVDWEVYKLGDFTLTDSPIGNYTPDDCPDGSCEYPESGQINAYTVDVSGYTWVHFDAYGYNGPVAPFSHDAGMTPEPATMLLLGSGLLGLFGLRRRV